MLEPDLIAPGEFAGEKQSLRGEVFLHELDERVWSHEYFADESAGMFAFTLSTVHAAHEF